MATATIVNCARSAPLALAFHSLSLRLTFSHSCSTLSTIPLLFYYLSLSPPHSGGEHVKSQTATSVEMQYSKIGIIEPKLYITCLLIAFAHGQRTTCTYVHLFWEKHQNGNSCKIWLIVVFGGF